MINRTGRGVVVDGDGFCYKGFVSIEDFVGNAVVEVRMGDPITQYGIMAKLVTMSLKNCTIYWEE